MAAGLLAGSSVSTPGVAGEWLVGAYAHDATFLGKLIGSGAAGRESGLDLHLGARTDRIEHWWGRPQAHAFISLNSRNTSNFVAAGLSWPISLTKRVYVRPGLGLAYTDGEAGLPAV